jgi:hypothetical protein
VADFWGYLGARMIEASSYNGAAMIMLSALHISVNPGIVNHALGVIAAIGGLIAVLRPEAGATK